MSVMGRDANEELLLAQYSDRLATEIVHTWEDLPENPAPIPKPHQLNGLVNIARSENEFSKVMEFIHKQLEKTTKEHEREFWDKLNQEIEKLQDKAEEWLSRMGQDANEQDITQLQLRLTREYAAHLKAHLLYLQAIRPKKHKEGK